MYTIGNPQVVSHVDILGS